MNKTRFDEIFLDGKRPYLWIGLVGFILYFRTLFYGFTYLDDNTLIIDHFYFLKDIGNIFQSFRQQVFHVLHSSAAYYRPMLTVSLILDAQLSGNGPFFYHLTNIVIHLVSSALVYLFFIKLDYKKEISFLVSLLFLVHPVLTQAVAWIPGRNDSLLALFFLAAFVFFIDYVKTGTTKYLNWHFLFFFFALFTKESGIFFPVTAVFYLLLVNKQDLKDSKFKKLYAGWAIIIASWFVLRELALRGEKIPYSISSIIQSLTDNISAIFIFIGKAVFPFNLSVLPTLQDSIYIYGILVVLLLLMGLIFIKNKRNGIIAFGGLWFVMYLIPSFIRPNPDYVADFIEHRSYLPIIGLIIVILEIIKVNKLDFKKVWLMYVGFGLVLLFSLINLFHQPNFKDRITFWESAVATSPSHPLAHKNLGAMYYLDGRLEEAEVEYRESLKLNESETMIHNNLGLIYMANEELERAEEEYNKELKINPYYDAVHYNYGLLHYKKGEIEKAEEMWLKTIQINPDYLDAYKNLIAIYLENNDEGSAEAVYREAARRGLVN